MSEKPRDDGSRMPTTAVTATAAGILALEGVGLAALTVWQVVAAVSGDRASLSGSFALIVLTAIGAICVIAFAAAVLVGRSWGRSGGIVTQLLVIAVAVGAATGAYAHPLLGLALALPAIAALVLLFLTARGAASAQR